MKLVSLK